MTTITSQASAPLLPWISDEHLSLFVFPIFFWAFSFFFMVIEWAGILQEYRLRTPTEEVTLNRVNRRDCLINVFFNQVIQVLAGLVVQLVDDSNNGSTTWNMMAQPLVSCLLSGLSFAGIDIIRLAKKYPGSIQGLEEALVVVVQSYLVPTFQFLVALFVADTWQYFSHRWCHTNKYVYRSIHSMHHRLYAPYTYGGQYVHPLESLIMDTTGNLLSLYASGMSVRLGMIFSAYVAFKFISDHCGYIFPFNPVHLFTGNDTLFHDIHHQSWGLKTNFAVHFTFWDWLLGTYWEDKASAMKNYERTRASIMAAEQKI